MDIQANPILIAKPFPIAYLLTEFIVNNLTLGILLFTIFMIIAFIKRYIKLTSTLVFILINLITLKLLIIYNNTILCIECAASPPLWHSYVIFVVGLAISIIVTRGVYKSVKMKKLLI
jgi:hypothetical protein